MSRNRRAPVLGSVCSHGLQARGPFSTLRTSCVHALRSLTLCFPEAFCPLGSVLSESYSKPAVKAPCAYRFTDWSRLPQLVLVPRARARLFLFLRCLTCPAAPLQLVSAFGPLLVLFLRCRCCTACFSQCLTWGALLLSQPKSHPRHWAAAAALASAPLWFLYSTYPLPGVCLCVFPSETTFRCACVLYKRFTSASLLPYYGASDSIHSVLCVFLVSASSKYTKMEFCKFVSVLRANSRVKHCYCRRRFEGHWSLSSCPVSLRL